MHVILLAAGRSTRLNPLSDKNFLEFQGKPLIQHQVEKLKRAGLEKISIVGNKNNLSQFETLFKDDENIQLCKQIDLETGMKGGTLAAAEKITSERVLIMSSNDLFEENVFKTLIKKCEEENDGVIVGKEVTEYFPGGYLKLNDQNHLTDIIEKPGAGNEPSNLINLVCHAFKNFPDFVEHLKKAQSENDDLYEVALDNYIKTAKAKMAVLNYQGSWQAIKYPWHVLKMMNHFLDSQTQNIHPTAEIAATAIIEGNVVIEKNVKILHNAVIKGPAYIGENSIVANNSLVRGSMVGKNCVVGFTTEVTRSYLNKEVWMHSNYIGDSIIDSNVSFGAGTVTGNLRFDEKNIKVKIKGQRIDTGLNKFGAVIGSGVRFGVNASTNPGIKIGQNSFIGGAVLVEKDVENKQLYLVDQTIKTIENTSVASVEDRQEMKNKIK